MTLSELATVLRRFWALVVGILAASVLAALAILYLPEEKFESTASVVVEPSSAQSLSFGATEAVQYLLPPIVQRARSDEFTLAIRHRVRAPRGLPLEISVDNEAGTAIVELTTRSTRPALARDAADWAALELIRRPLSGFVTIRSLERAGVAESTTSKRAAPILFGSAALGLILGVFAAIAASAVRRRLPSGREVSTRYGLPLLGEIPGSRHLPRTAREVIEGDAHLAVREAFERLAATVYNAQVDKRTIAVTSWTEGEGKTTVAAGLAYSLASFGDDVTALDLDLRKPGLHDALGVDLSPGVSELVSNHDGRSPVHRTQLARLEVIPAGVPHEHPVRLVTRGLMAVEQSVAKRTVIADTAPMFAAETTLIAPDVDAVVIVVDARKRNPADFEQALADLRSTGAQILGLVVNRARLSKSQRPSSAYYDRRTTKPSASARGGEASET